MAAFVMIPRVPLPRWLPATIGVLAGLLAVKSVTLVRAITASEPTADLSFLYSNARAAASAETTPAKPPPDKLADKGADKPADQKAAEPQKPPAEPPLSAAERTVLLELRQRRQELDARETVLGERESVLAAAQDKLSARVEELQGLQQRLQTLEADRRRLLSPSLLRIFPTRSPSLQRRRKRSEPATESTLRRSLAPPRIFASVRPTG